MAAGALALRASSPTRSRAGSRSRRPTRSSTKVAAKFSTGLISNIDDKLLGQTRRHLPTDFDLVVTAQQVRSYKPDPAHFKEFQRRIEGDKKGWVHIAASQYHDVEPLTQAQGARRSGSTAAGEELEAGRKAPDAEVSTLAEAVKLLGA